MDDRLAALLNAAPDRIGAVTSLNDLADLETELIGRQSLIAEGRRSLGQREPDERKRLGALINDTAAQLSALLAERRRVLEVVAETASLEAERVDVTLPRLVLGEGTHHLITSTMAEVTDIFAALGYRVAAGPEAETAWHNFDALNTPPDHPARAESDTFYLNWGDPADEMLLRAHTSPMQVRYMMENPPPVHVVVPGRTFRSDTLDATHSPVFHQVEGLAVDTHITFSDLKGTLAHFAREFFGPDERIRLLPHFFPFTEPSAEMHVSCFACDQTGCRVCQNTGWIELMGSGMVDPNVFDAVGYDPEEVTGFAFGMGVERIAQVRHGITHVRHLYENDLRALRQFT